MKTLKVHGRYLAWDDGTPFFYLGDTAWELFHRPRYEDIEEYLRIRARQGFTVIQGVALAEFNGVTVPNAYGRLPFHFTDDLPDPTRPDTEGDDSYWAHMDRVIRCAGELGLFICLLPTWGDKFNLAWGRGPEIFTPENAYLYGKWIATRYRDEENIIWMLGGDRSLDEERHRRIIDEMARGIREADRNHLITFHPRGHTRSTDFVGDADYIDFHTAQSGHALPSSAPETFLLQIAAVTDKPYMDSEPRYEDHPACFASSLGYYWNADDIRESAYWDVLTGACGHTYGNHCVWSMNSEVSSYFPYRWQDVLTHTGAEQIGYVKQLRLSRDYFSLRPAPELLPRNFPGMGHMVAARGDNYAYLYSPLGIPFEVALSGFADAKCLRALWFNPRTGEETLFGILPPEGSNTFAPPSQGKGCDWVLVLDAVAELKR